MNLMRYKGERPSIKPFLHRHKVIVAIVCIWLLFCLPFLVKGLVPFPSRFLVSFFPPWSAYYGMAVKNSAMPDVITQIYPWKSLVAESWKRGVIPLWNPYSFSGSVHAANYQSSVFSPVNALFLYFSQPVAWSIAVLLQPLCAGIFMYLFLCFGLKRSPLGAVLGSLAFMFCGFLTVWMGYGTLDYAILVLPVVLLGIIKWYESPSWWWGILVSLSLTFSFFSGHFQMSLYVLGIAIAYAAYLFFLDRSIRKYIGILSFLVIGLLLSVPQLVISFDAFSVSNRSGSFVGNAGIPWNYFVTLFSPDFFGNPVTRNDWFGQYAEWASYIGIIPLFLASIGLQTMKKNRLWFFLYVIIGSLLLAVLSPISWIFYALKIPVLSTSVATRLIVFVSFSLCVFAAYGWDDLVESWEQYAYKNIVRSTIFFGIVLALAWVGAFFLHLSSVEHFQTAIHNLVLPSVFLLTACVLSFLSFRIPRARAFILIGLLLLTGFDMYRYASKWMPFDPKEYIYPKVNVISYLKDHASVDRVFGNIGDELNTYFGIPSIEGYDAIYQARYGEFISAAGNGKIQPLERSVVAIDRQGLFTKRWLDLLGVRYILYRKSDGRNVWAFPHWNYDSIVSRYQDDQYEVLENTNAFPRAFLATSYKVETGNQAILNDLTSSDVDIRKTVILERKPQFDPEEHASEAAKLQITLYHPERVLVRIETDSPKLLFLSDVYDSGWHALVNGVEVPLYRADYAFRAVSVPSGLSTVEFYYAPERLRRAVSLALFIGFVLLAGSVRKLIYYGRRYL